MSDLNGVLNRIGSARTQLTNHVIYSKLRNIEDVRVFMTYHVFAVWDFMSLLKSLQRHLAGVEVPWIPHGSARTRRLINEIVLEEESDEIDGRTTSHFTLYHTAMTSIGADTGPINALIHSLRCGNDLKTALDVSKAPAGACAFVTRTFEIIESDKVHTIAAAFAFGREQAMSPMFRALVGSLASEKSAVLSPFLVYLDRHIGLDEDHHGPMAIEMVSELCGEDAQKWEQAAEAAFSALSARLALWSAITAEIDRLNSHDSASRRLTKAVGRNAIGRERAMADGSLAERRVILGG